MSDAESYHSTSQGRGILDKMKRTDEVLNDHRHQAQSLPIRVAGADEDAEVAVEEAVEQEDDEAAREVGAEGDTTLKVPVGSQQAPTSFRETIWSPGSHTGKSGRNRAASFSDQRRSFARSKDPGDRERRPSATGFQQSGRGSTAAPKYRLARSSSKENLELDLASPMIRTRTNDTAVSDGRNKRERRLSRSSIDSDDSQKSRSSQETEEDVCFPMLPEIARVKGIDFNEMEEFVKQETEDKALMKSRSRLGYGASHFSISNKSQQDEKSVAYSNDSFTSRNAMRYTPKNILRKSTDRIKKLKSRNTIRETDVADLPDDYISESSSTKNGYNSRPDVKEMPVDDTSSDNVKFAGPTFEDTESAVPTRFSFFTSDSQETVHAPDFSSLLYPGQNVRDMFGKEDNTWWLDCSCPTDTEMKMMAKAFGIHPLTAEDIRMQETREKVELFRTYYFVCFHTFEPDDESEDYLEPINVYIVVFREGVLSFHFSPVSHPANVRRRIRQLQGYVNVSADWICYALIDDITDGFAPAITSIEREADAIEDSVFVVREMDFGYMLQRIGDSRKKVMTLMRLLSGKADVIKMFAKRCQDEAAQNSTLLPSQYYQGNSTGPPNMCHYSSYNDHGVSHSQGSNLNIGAMGHAPNSSFVNQVSSQLSQQASKTTQPRADIALFLGDIQDHIVTMFQNLLAYEKILSRSHSNYLAQLQVQSVISNNRVTDVLSKVTLVGTLIVPLNLVTGLFGMNVRVPGEQKDGLNWFFGIIGVMACIVLVFIVLARAWLHSSDKSTIQETASRSIRKLGFKTKRDPPRSVVSFPNKYD
ncbi:Piso0_002293 [Millerozyma farinosa CBS 7064]|uniref:Piso0_002293 protein n=1 Tax=Pichia sorbitophila (strain ATCC MYA-4447 / BCRC 22081 / CBS 7064 / NBRC 10061 / NRRL Y-12695) TaxID=559304 RepID=G8YC82_PICSO|nr:Piso0_002293 [Millerozyma farinosa CBS 7064]